MSDEQELEQLEQPVVAKKRGRPKGSTNAGKSAGAKAAKGKPGRKPGKKGTSSAIVEPPVLAIRLVRPSPMRPADPETPEIVPEEVLWISATKQRNAYLVESLLYPGGDANRKTSPSTLIYTSLLKGATETEAVAAVEKCAQESEARYFTRRARNEKVAAGWDALGPVAQG